MSEERSRGPGIPANIHNLGRDDPIWPLYVEEATKWDAKLVEGWNQ